MVSNASGRTGGRVGHYASVQGLERVCGVAEKEEATMKAVDNYLEEVGIVSTELTQSGLGS